jgi:hypothetical protein
MSESRFSPSVEYPGALRRLGLAAVLVGCFAHYAARRAPHAATAVAAPAAPAPAPGRHVVVYTAGPAGPPAAAPTPSPAADELGARLGRLFQMALGRMPFATDAVPRPEHFAAALSGRAEPATLTGDAARAAEDAKALGDFLEGLGIPSLNMDMPAVAGERPPPLDESTKAALMEEAAAGIAGPATQRLIDAAEKDGTLDLPLYGGRSMRQIRDHAKAIGARVDASGENGRREQAQAHGVSVYGDDPRVVVPMMLGFLEKKDDEDRAVAAQVLCDVRFARYPGALAAKPALEAMVRDGKPGAEFAQLALKRIRYTQAQLELGVKNR